MDFPLLQARRRAMGTVFTVAVPDGTPHGREAALDALDLIDSLEDKLTIYRDSTTTRLNETAFAAPVPVDRTLFGLFELCATLTNDTAGAFDAATGALSRAWGFVHKDFRVPEPEELAKARDASGFRHVILDAAAQTVRFRRNGLELNFGAIGKGFSLDRAGELLRTKWNIHCALLAGSTSSVLALGAPPGQPRGWPLAIRHPADDGRHLSALTLRDAALGTSAATHQSFAYNGRSFGHVLDPRTGQPADALRSATCLAPTAAEADALSTAFYVAGAAWAAEHCRSRPHLGAVLLGDGEEVETIETAPGVFTGG